LEISVLGNRIIWPGCYLPSCPKL